MRKVLLRRRRRGGEVDPITAAYDQILATDPTVPILLRLREYRGQQVLFQDSLCLIPVESIGDPIGGVRHPITGEILVVQTVDADRPIWGGEDVGAIYNGSTQYLESPEVATNLNFIPQTGIFTAASRCIFDRDAASSDTMIAATRAVTTQKGIYLLRESRNAPTNRARAFFIGSINRELSGPLNSLPANENLLTFTDGDGSVLRLGVGGSILGSGPFATTTDPITEKLTIGTTPDQRAGRWLSGSMWHAIIWDRQISAAERAIL